MRDPAADPADTKKLSRDHVVDVRAGSLVSIYRMRVHIIYRMTDAGNLLSICGGKWTTYRAMAQDALDKALELNRDRSCQLYLHIS